MADDASQAPDSQEKWSRYQRVKEILNRAQGSVCPSYQGYGKFWELPLPEFLTVEIYGVRMIAPPPAPSGAGATGLLQLAPKSSCCHAGGDATVAAPPPTPPGGRGAASGLIKGLKGECPFDGTQYPPLLWDGTPLDTADIQFIQDWIDSGCPEDDRHHTAAKVHEASVRARARGDEEHPLHSGSTNQYQNDNGGLKVRKNVNSLSWEELQRYCAAVARMKSFDQYPQDQRSFGFWARLHANDCQHGWEEFLTWHRVYLYYFEEQLQDIDPTVTIPYWDWTDNYDQDITVSLSNAASPTPQDNGTVPVAFQCWLNQSGWDALAASKLVSAADLKALATIVTTPPGEGGNAKDFKSYSSGLRLFKAAGVAYGQNKSSDDAIMGVLGNINPLWHRLRWPGGDAALAVEAYPAPGDITNILQLTNFYNFGSGPMSNHFFGALENIHNMIHNFSGGANPNYKMGTNPLDRNNEPQAGDMVNAGVTAFDPIFWSHHSNVDRLWAMWQALHPNVNPDNLSSPLPPFRQIVQDTLNISNFGYEYMNSSQVYPADDTVPISKFKSAKTPVQASVLADHQRAEIRLHKVKYRTRGGFHIRVFLNSPGADEKTPTRGNPNYVGILNTFSGYCVGGPGHCDPPPETTRKFDHRARHRKTPGNFRIDATTTVQNLIAKGESSFQVNLVVLNTDGTLATDALLLNAVSLNFVE
jgi:tyrosinase